MDSGSHQLLMVLPFPVVGAAEDYGLTIASGLATQGWDVTLWHAAAVSFGSGTTRGMKTMILPKSLPGLWRQLARHKGGILHVNQVFLPAISAARLARRHPVVVTAHTPALPVELSLRGHILQTFSRPAVDRWIALSESNRDLLIRSR